MSEIVKDRYTLTLTQDLAFHNDEAEIPQEHIIHVSGPQVAVRDYLHAKGSPVETPLSEAIYDEIVRLLKVKIFKTADKELRVGYLSRRKGEWVEDDSGTYCSACGKHKDQNYDYFCAYCGAEMKV